MSSARTTSNWPPASFSATPMRHTIADNPSTDSTQKDPHHGDHPDQLPPRERRFHRRRLGQRRAPARSLPWRLDEYGELHYRVSRFGDVAAPRAAEGHGP